MCTLKPWLRSTGPRTAEGKTRSARNAFKGGQARQLRELRAALNALIRDQHDLLDRLHP